VQNNIDGDSFGKIFRCLRIIVDLDAAGGHLDASLSDSYLKDTKEAYLQFSALNAVRLFMSLDACKSSRLLS
jgi:hypothetical protein